MGDKFTFAHISSASEPTKPFSHQQHAGCEGGKPIYFGRLPARARACLRSVAALLALQLCGGKKRLVKWFQCQSWSQLELQKPIALLRKVGNCFWCLALPWAHPELEQSALHSILDSCNCERALEGRGTKGILILRVFAQR